MNALAIDPNRIRRMAALYCPPKPPPPKPVFRPSEVSGFFYVRQGKPREQHGLCRRAIVWLTMHGPCTYLGLMKGCKIKRHTANAILMRLVTRGLARVVTQGEGHGRGRSATIYDIVRKGKT